jgi:cytochrome b561
MTVVEAHMTVGILLLALNLIAGVWGVVTWRRRVATSPWLQQTLALSHTVVLLQAVFGLYLLAGGHRAPQRLHYVYGLLPTGAVAFAYSARTPDTRRNLLQFSVVALVIFALAVRAFMTGRGM